MQLVPGHCITWRRDCCAQGTCKHAICARALYHLAALRELEIICRPDCSCICLVASHMPHGQSSNFRLNRNVLHIRSSKTKFERMHYKFEPNSVLGRHIGRVQRRLQGRVQRRVRGRVQGRVQGRVEISFRSAQPRRGPNSKL
eukprot:5665708-Pleurochrysis_carterae.AAC.4